MSVPIFAVAPADQKIAKGKTCRISIRVSGKPRPFVTWFKDGQYIFDDGRRCFTVKENGDECLIMENIGNLSYIVRYGSSQKWTVMHQTVQSKRLKVDRLRK